MIIFALASGAVSNIILEPFSYESRFSTVKPLFSLTSLTNTITSDGITKGIVNGNNVVTPSPVYCTLFSCLCTVTLYCPPIVWNTRSGISPNAPNIFFSDVPDIITDEGGTKYF